MKALQRFQAWWGSGRADPRGSEEGGKERRPWLVLSNRALHNRELVVVLSVTSAESRHRSIDFLVRPVEFVPEIPRAQPAEPSAADTQQLWTFSRKGERIRYIHHLARKFAAPVTSRLTHHLRAPLGCANEENLRAAVGAVIWVQLLKGPKGRSDLEPFATRLREMGVPWNDEDVRLPALVIASDVYREAAGDDTFRLVTVVPLVYAPRFQRANETENPRVQVPTDRCRTLSIASDYPYLSALTTLLLTLDYRAEHKRVFEHLPPGSWRLINDRRPHFANRGAETWLATEREVREVVESVCWTLGLPEERRAE